MTSLLLSVSLVTLDPGHFHAALVQNRAYPEVSSAVKVFAPEGPELDAHLKLVESFNARTDSPTAWREDVYRGADYLSRFVAAAKAGELGESPVVVLAGKNDRKGEYAHAAVEAGVNVLADKPLAITPEVFAQTARAARLAQAKGLYFADIMTERNEITSILQRALTQDRALYGEQEKGTPDDPAITKLSVHHFCKLVNGAPLRRPEWYYDTAVQGEGLTDVATHLVDLVQWEAFPGVRLATNDVEVVSARAWPTRITPEQFRMSTGGTRTEPFDCLANGEFTWRLRGVCCKVSVVWNFMAPPGTGDTHDSLMRGTKAEVFIRQDAKEGLVRLVNVAAEVPGMPAFVRALAERGVAVSLGHQLATSPTDVEPCLAAGAKAFTHLGNGIPNEVNRHDNIVFTALVEDRASVMFIPDGHHLPDTMLKLYCRAVPVERLIAVSDAQYPAGLPAGEYEVCGAHARLEPNGLLWNPARNCLVGATTPLAACMRLLKARVGLTDGECRRIGRDNALRLIGA